MSDCGLTILLGVIVSELFEEGGAASREVYGVWRHDGGGEKGIVCSRQCQDEVMISTFRW